MRAAWVLVIGVVLVGCKEKAPGDPDPPVASSRPAAAATEDLKKIQEEESEVLARRDELKRERERVVADRAALEEKKKAAGAEGAAAVEAEEKAIAERETKLAADETALASKLDTLMATYQQALAGAGTGDQVVRREAQVAARERDFSRREQAMASREAEMAARERDLAKREREMCSAGTTTTIIREVEPPTPGKRYSKRDVEPVLARARRHMAEKGLLSSDLPAQARALEKEATESMAEGDFGKAKFAADQFLAVVDGVRIDKGFIAGKISRLNAAVKGKTLAAGVGGQVDGLFREATADYGDGKFSGANGKLNRIYALIQ